MNEELIEQPISYSTECEHYWIESSEQDENSNLLSVVCNKCWSGASIDPNIIQIADGKMVENDNG